MASERSKKGGGKETAVNVADPYRVTVSYSNNNAGIMQGNGADWFGPLNPMSPTAPPEVEGRRFDFPSGYNLAQQPRVYDAVGFPQLRALADSYDILRLVIETRKDQISRLKWNIVPRDASQKRDEDVKMRCKKVEDFFVRPDRKLFWEDWLRLILEDLLVLDAPTLYRRKTLGGDLYALEVIDGGSIKVVIDDWGRTPEAPAVAYQQVLKGMPAVDYTAEDILYKPRNLRPHKVYGYSPVEQIIMTINIALRREVFQLNYFTEGNIPEALIGVPENWGPEQIRQFQEWFDGVLQGNLAERRRARFVPAAIGKTYIETKGTELFGKAEEWLARVVCFAFSISSQAFVQQMNRSTAETSQEEAALEGLAPLQRWIKGLIDTVILDDFGYNDLEFHWQEDQEIDPSKKQVIISGYTGDGLMTLNEGRLEIGLDPVDHPMFNKLLMRSSMGYVDISAGPIPTTAQTMTGQPGGGSGEAVPPEAPVQSVDDGADAEKTVVDDEEELAEELEAEDLFYVDPERPTARARARTVSSTVAGVLAAQADTVINAIIERLPKEDPEKVAKAEDNWIDELLLGIQADFESVMDQIESALQAMFRESGRQAIAQIGPSSEKKLVGQVNRASAAWAQARVGELIAGIDETTKELIRTTIAEGISSGATADEIASSLRSSYAFSAERAQTIAETEIARANSYGALDGYNKAIEAGVTVMKTWLRLEDACPVCQANEEAGEIGIDEAFPSGDLAPPAHPNCRCVIVPKVKE